MLPFKLFLPAILLLVAVGAFAQDSARATVQDTAQQHEATLHQKRLTKEDVQALLQTPGLKVFVVAPDAAAVTHATNALQYATDWQIVDDKSLAQLIVRFAFTEIGMGDKKGRAQFIDPKNNIVISETRTASTAFSWDFNTKRGVIDRIVNKQIRKLIKGQQLE